MTTTKKHEMNFELRHDNNDVDDEQLIWTAEYVDALTRVAAQQRRDLERLERGLQLARARLASGCN